LFFAHKVRILKSYQLVKQKKTRKTRSRRNVSRFVIEFNLISRY
jgi:hypothetical protein